MYAAYVVSGDDQDGRRSPVLVGATPSASPVVYEYPRPRSIEMLSDQNIIQTINEIRTNIIEQTN